MADTVQETRPPESPPRPPELPSPTELAGDRGDGPRPPGSAYRETAAAARAEHADAVTGPADTTQPADTTEPADTTGPTDTPGVRSGDFHQTADAVGREHAAARDQPAAGDAPDPLRVDQPDLPAGQPGDRAVEYGRPLDAATGQPPPLFDGPPARDQVSQGGLNDCGVVAAMGAVAGHRPDQISSSIAENPDGTYRVTLSGASFTSPDRVEPTGGTTELTVTGDAPVYAGGNGISAYADQTGSGVAWPGVVEKALAGVDQTWDSSRLPAGSPTGYDRLDQGSDAWDRAELLTQLTGQPAEVRPLDKAAGSEQAVEAELRAALDADKPVLVGIEAPKPGEQLPHNLVGGHAYEVVGVDNGMVQLHNPWNFDHPTPMSTRDFLDHARDVYTTLD